MTYRIYQKKCNNKGLNNQDVRVERCWLASLPSWWHQWNSYPAVTPSGIWWTSWEPECEGPDRQGRESQRWPQTTTQQKCTGHAPLQVWWDMKRLRLEHAKSGTWVFNLGLKWNVWLTCHSHVLPGSEWSSNPRKILPELFQSQSYPSGKTLPWTPRRSAWSSESSRAGRCPRSAWRSIFLPGVWKVMKEKLHRHRGSS